MNEREKFRSGVMVDLLISDHETGGRLRLPPGTRDRAVAAIQELLVDPAALDEHVQWLHQRRRENLDLRSRYSDLLDDEHVETVLARGVAALDDDTLATLLLNPIALYGLYDEIDERLPDAWLPVMEAEGRALMDRLGVKVRVPQALADSAGRSVVPDVVVAAGAGDAGAFVFRGEATTQRRGEDCIVVGFGYDEQAIRLRRRVAEHAFGDVVRSFELRVLRVPVAGRGDVYQAQLEMEPAPTQNDLEIIVRFREGGGERRFRLEVPPGLRRDPASVPRPRTRSALSDPLPAAAFDLHGGSEWVDDAWPATLILRSHSAAARAERFPGWTCGASGPASLSAANADCVMHTASLYALGFAEVRHESATN